MNRRLFAVSVAIPIAVLAAAFFWIKSRKTQENTKDKSTQLFKELSKVTLENIEDKSTELIAELPKVTLEPLEVQEKLEVIQRKRLFTLEEEKFVVDEEGVCKEEFVGENELTIKVSESCEDKVDTPINMTEETTETLSEIKVEVLSENNNLIVETMESKIPDVASALQDSLCGSTSPQSSPTQSPTKSEHSWNDIVDEDRDADLDSEVANLDNKVNCLALVSEKLNHLVLEKGERQPDSGVVSPSEEEVTRRRLSGEREKKRRHSSGNSQKSKSSTGSGDAGFEGSVNGDASAVNNEDANGDAVSDSGQGSDRGEAWTEDTQLLVYHFHIPDYLCGKLIGNAGTFINKLKTNSNCNVIIGDIKDKKSLKTTKRKPTRKRDEWYGEGQLKQCSVEGTRSNIDKCLDMVREKFVHNPELTLEQTNKSDRAHTSMNNGSITLNLAQGIMHDVFVSSIVSGAHVFLQQPGHPTFPALERLDQCMLNVYNNYTTPEVPRPIQHGSIAVAPSNGGWYRCLVVSYNESEDSCDIKYIDYGGYETVPADQIRQIRTDFLSLPFQAIECYLANIIPSDVENVAAAILEELVSGQVVQARQIGHAEDGTPLIHLYRRKGGVTTMVNRELVDNSVATWLEAVIVPVTSPIPSTTPPAIEPNHWITSDHSSALSTPLSPLDLRGCSPPFCPLPLYTATDPGAMLDPGPLTPACTPTWNTDPFNYQVQMMEHGPIGTPYYGMMGQVNYMENSFVESLEGQNMDSSGLSDYMEFYQPPNAYPVFGDYLPSKWSEGHDGPQA